jgi:hypothetical protein
MTMDGDLPSDGGLVEGEEAGSEGGEGIVRDIDLKVLGKVAEHEL